jgi:hypothetical protein
VARAVDDAKLADAILRAAAQAVLEGQDP